MPHGEHHYAGDFEMHLTVRTADEMALRAFQNWCESHEMKCVQIVLSRGQHTQQPMATWRRRETTLQQVVEEAQAFASGLNLNGVEVTRVKVEAAPYNNNIPVDQTQLAAHSPQNYFEHHIKVERDASASRETLTAVSERHGAHLSRNAFKQTAQGREERFVTLRDYENGRAESLAALTALIADLRAAGENVVEYESEYCVYDSNVELDAGWLVDAVEP